MLDGKRFSLVAVCFTPCLSACNQGVTYAEPEIGWLHRGVARRRAGR
jgi:hypothetical protein